MWGLRERDEFKLFNCNGEVWKNSWVGRGMELEFCFGSDGFLRCLLGRRDVRVRVK